MQIILGLYARRELVSMGGTEERTRGTEMGEKEERQCESEDMEVVVEKVLAGKGWGLDENKKAVVQGGVGRGQAKPQLSTNPPITTSTFATNIYQPTISTSSWQLTSQDRLDKYSRWLSNQQVVNQGNQGVCVAHHCHRDQGTTCYDEVWTGWEKNLKMQLRGWRPKIGRRQTVKDFLESKTTEVLRIGGKEF